MRKILMQVGDPVGHMGLTYVAERRKDPNRVCSLKCGKCDNIFDARLSSARSGLIQNCGCTPKQACSRVRLAGQDYVAKQRRTSVKNSVPTLQQLNIILRTLDRPRLSSSELVKICADLVAICDTVENGLEVEL